MRVLFTSPIIEHPPAGGPQLRIENSIKALARVCDLRIVARTSQGLIGGADAENYFRRFSNEFGYSPWGATQFTNRYLRKIQQLWRSAGSRGHAAEAEFLLDYAEKRNIDCIWFGYGNISFPLIRAIKARRPDIRVICDTDSVWSRFILRELPFQRNPLRKWTIRRKGRQKQAEEKRWVNLCDVTTAVSEVDATYYKTLSSEPSRIHIFSNVIDLETYVAPPVAPAELRRPCVYLAGTFGHYYSPMDVAARWVLTDILPRVRKVIPNLHFYIVGRDSDRSLAHVRGAGVSVLGKVPSVLPYLCHADVSLVPLKFESGTRFKILEAAACNVPIVSTTLGAEGLEVQNRQHLLLADDADKFAEAIIELIRNRSLAKTLAVNCRELVRKYYSIDGLEQQGRRILKYVVNGESCAESGG